VERATAVILSHAKTQRRKAETLKNNLAALRLCLPAFMRLSWQAGVMVSSCAVNAVAQQRADFIIIEKPQHLSILNQYQQQLSPEETSALVSYSPFLIVNPNGILGDGLTHCMKAELNGVPYYFVKDDSASLIGGPAAGVLKTYKSAILLADTIAIVQQSAMELLDVAGRKRTPLAQGAQLRRVFRSSRLTLVQVLTTGAYGWVNLKEGSDKGWTVVKGSMPGTSKNLEQLIPEIQLKLNAVNGKLIKLYTIFNRKASEVRTAPQWSLQASGTGLLCTLPSDSSAQFYKESTRWLSKDIESLVLGTHLRVASIPGRIEIR
jgi:hypothetical protein